MWAMEVLENVGGLNVDHRSVGKGRGIICGPWKCWKR